MKTTRTDQKILRNNRRGFAVAAALFTIAAVLIGVLTVHTAPGYPGWVGPAAYLGIVTLGAIIGMTITGALVAHLALKANIARETRVIDGTVDGQ